MNYTHLTQDERYQIAILAKAGHDKSEIARLMDRHKSTISREMTRNRGARGYRPKQAHALSQARIRAAENSPRVAAETWVVVDLKLAETWSPEQISGHLKVNAGLGVRSCKTTSSSPLPHLHTSSPFDLLSSNALQSARLSPAWYVALTDRHAPSLHYADNAAQSPPALE